MPLRSMLALHVLVGRVVIRTHKDSAAKQKLTIPAFEPGQCGIDEDGAEGRAEARCETLQADLNWVRWEDVVEEDGKEVEHGVEVHAWVELLAGAFRPSR